MDKKYTQEAWVFAKWDEEYEVYYSETNIPGLNIEANSLGEFEEAMFDVAPELIFANIIKPQLYSDGFECEFIDGEVIAKTRASFAKKSVPKNIPEMFPFNWRGAESRQLSLAMG